MADFRYIFPSYDWDDAWLVNQIINLPNILGVKNMGFLKGVPNEEIKQSDEKIKKWIDENMQNCSCLILFCGERTYKSKWVKYELESAREKKKGRFIIHLADMVKMDNTLCKQGIDPYEYHGFYNNKGTGGYIIKSYNWIKDDGINNIGAWIEDAISRRPI